MARGWGVGFVGFAALFLIELSGGARTWKADLTAAAAIAGAAKALVAAVVVSGIEETLFRGVAFAGLRPAVGGPNALVLSALLYSAAHFFARPEPPARPGIGSGFETLAGMMTGFADPDRLIPAFATLFVLGSVLALSRWDAGDLYFAFGLHSGVVFWSKMRGVLTRTAPGNAGGGDLVSGWPALALACVVLVLYWVIRRERFRAGDGVRQPFTEVDPGCHL